MINKIVGQGTITKDEVLEYLKNKDIKIFFTGIGGISMSAIAAALIQKGYKVGGSDNVECETALKVRDMGAEIFFSYKSENIDGYDMLVYMARIKEDNPEILRARELGIPIIKRAQMLAALMSGYKKSIGITGTHGKSSITSMISEIFMQAGTDPTFFIGAIYPPINSAYKIGKSDYFILESDEAFDSFLNFPPDIAVISNIEMDHPDYFTDLDDMIDSYKEYLADTGELAIINADDANSLDTVRDFKKKILTFAIEASADIHAKNIVSMDGFPEFDIYTHGEKYAHIKLNVPGDYNIYNALAAASAAYSCGISGDAVSRGLNIFKGASRRLEYKGAFNDVKVYEDYAHHPTELKKMFEAVKKIASGKIWCVFQPHTYSRTRELEAELCEALSGSPANIILTDIYSATEINTYNIYSEDIAKKTNCTFISSFNDIADYLKSNCEPGDMILLTGAGNVNKITDLLI